MQVWRPCPLWEPSSSHPIVLVFLLFFLYACLFMVLLYFVFFAFLGFPYFCSVFFPSVLLYSWLGLLTCKPVSQITYTVLVETLNQGCSINQWWQLCVTYTPWPEKNGPPKHVKITLWIENVSDYFSLYHEMPSICNVHVKFHDN